LRSLSRAVPTRDAIVPLVDGGVGREIPGQIARLERNAASVLAASDAEVFCLKAVATWHRYQLDRFIVLPLEAGCGKVHGADAQQSPVDLVALGVHWALGLAFGLVSTLRLPPLKRPNGGLPLEALAKSSGRILDRLNHARVIVSPRRPQELAAGLSGSRGVSIDVATANLAGS
jgi:hypothetical protein